MKETNVTTTPEMDMSGTDDRFERIGTTYYMPL